MTDLTPAPNEAWKAYHAQAVARALDDMPPEPARVRKKLVNPEELITSRNLDTVAQQAYMHSRLMIVDDRLVVWSSREYR